MLSLRECNNTIAELTKDIAIFKNSKIEYQVEYAKYLERLRDAYYLERDKARVRDKSLFDRWYRG